MGTLKFDLQRFAIIPTLISDEDGERYFNTIPGAQVVGFGGTFFVNHGAGCEIQCSNDDSHVYNDTVAPNVVINGAGGSDYLINDGTNVKIFGNGGRDRIYNHNLGTKTTLDGGNGNDYIDNRAANVEIYCGKNNDYVWNNGSKVTIEGGTGDDELYNHGGTNVSIDGGKDKDHIYNFGKKVTVLAGEGDDHVGNNNDNVTIDAGTGKDSVYNDSNSVSIKATEDDTGDYVYNEGSKITIEAGAGDDSIDNRYSNAEHIGSSVTIDAGDGKNQINLDGGNNISVKTGEHDDTIISSVSSGNFRDLSIDTGKGRNIVSVNSATSYVTIDGGDDTEGVDAVLNEAANARISLNGGNDYICNKGDYAVIFGGDDGDVIENYGNNAFIHGDDKDSTGSRKVGDYIYTDKGNDVTIDAGNNADTVEAYHDVKASIAGGAGKDLIYLHRLAASDIRGLFSDSVNFVKDIWNIYLGIKGAPFTASLQIQDWLGALISSKDTPILSSGSKTSITVATTLLTAISAWQNLNKLRKRLGELFGTESTINGGEGDDTVVSDGLVARVYEYAADDSKDKLLNFIGNKFDTDSNLSTIHITRGTVKNITLDDVKLDSADVMINVGEGSIRLVKGDNKKFKLREADGKTTTLAYKCDPEKADTVCSIFGGDEHETIWDTISGEVYRNALYGAGGDDVLIGTTKNDTLDGGDGSDTLTGGKGDDVLYSGGGTKNSLVGGADKDTIYSTLNLSDYNHSYDTISGGAGKDSIVVVGRVDTNGVWYENGHVSIEGGADDDTINNRSSNSTITGGTGDDSIFTYGSKNLFRYATGDGKDKIIGIGATDTLDITKGLISSAKIVDKDVIFTVGKGTIKLVNAVNKKFNLRERNGTSKNGTLTTRAYSKNSKGEVICSIFGSAKGEELIDNVGFKRKTPLVPGATTPKDPVIGTVNKNVIYGAGGHDVLRANDKGNTLYGGMGKDLLFGGDGRDKLYGQTGNDTIWGGDGWDTLSGGSGNDKLFGEKGTDSLVGGSGNDTLFGGDDTDFLRGGKGNDSLDGGSGHDFLSGDEDKDKLFGKEGDDTLEGGSGNDTLWGGDDNDKLNGGEGNDSLKGGKGNDKLWGGKGNDTLWGESGADTFFYSKGDGKDVICGFDDNDTLTFDNLTFKSSCSKYTKIITLNFDGGGSVAFKSYTAKTFHINNSTYKLNGLKFEKQ